MEAYERAGEKSDLSSSNPESFESGKNDQATGWVHKFIKDKLKMPTLCCREQRGFVGQSGTKKVHYP